MRGANENNLRSVDVDIPRDAIVAFTGVSGSGKSSLAFGTIFAEAQRRFFESVAPYARRLIQQGHTPHVNEISGLPPAVALQQRRGTPSSRSTVGTLTTLSNSMRMLYSRAGTYPAGLSRLDSDAFSPNTAAGACPTCHGLGVAHTVTEESLVPDTSLSIREGAIAAWPGAWQGKNLRDIVIELGYNVDVPWNKLPRKSRDWLLFTEEQPTVKVTPQRDRIEKPYTGRFWSAKSYVLHTLADTKSQSMRDRALRYMRTGSCPDCGGTGLKPDALSVTIAGYSIAELGALPLTELAERLKPVAASSTSDVAVTIASDLVQRITVLLELGLGYLGLTRSTLTLSPGEMQRLRIATQLRSGLFGVIYVLDEPSAGLHPADVEPLLEVLETLKASGNSVYVVEHNMDIVRNADWVVDVGPKAGQGGGVILYSGPVAGLAHIDESLTRPFLFRANPAEAEADPMEAAEVAEAGEGRAVRHPLSWLRLEGITHHNLQNLDADVPVGVLTAVTGVSGSGKSTLVSKVLAEIVGRDAQTVVAKVSGDSRDSGGGGDEAEAAEDSGEVIVRAVAGTEVIDRLVKVDQKPIGRTPRSNLA
ncbi:MAG TPA: ABC transporter, partial [Glaciihabitans sp.]|nr:ABC transporter [Glaciihabitans sp.]